MTIENLTVEEMMPFFGIKGHVHLYEGVSTEGFPGGAPVRIMQTDQACYLGFHWNTLGDLNYLMAGKWVLNVFFEKLGPGDGPTIPPVNVSFISEPRTYWSTISVPPNTVDAGTYHVAVTLTMRGPAGHPAPIAAYADLGVIQFYEGGPLP